MNKYIIQTCLALLIIGVSACKKDYLEYDYAVDGTLSEEQVFASNEHTRNFLNNVYRGLVENRDGDYRYELNGEFGLSTGSDEAVSALPGAGINVFNNGSWGPTLLYDDVYIQQYRALRSVNIFLKNAPTSAIIDDATLSKQTLIGEAYFLRAMFHFELLKRYGGVIIATKPFGLEENLDLPKNTFDEVAAQIIADCDLAASNISYATSVDHGTALKGRATKAAALALKSRTLLYLASPLNNPSNDIAKWQAAANAAKAVIDLSGTKHGLLTTAQLANLWNFGTQAFNKEIIFSAETKSSTTIDVNNAPPSYTDGNGRTNPTQELVDAFEMKATGKSINTAGSGYNASNPYVGRDDRFDLFINYNGLNFRSVNIDTRVGAKDNNSQATGDRTTSTGYYLRKFLNTTNTAATRRVYVYFRYAEILLNYAEALNETMASPSFEVYNAINDVRRRGTTPPTDGLAALQSTNINGNGYVPATRDAMRLRIHNERRVELCFEEHRFFDVRRWKLGDQFFNKPVRGVRITGTTAPFTYTYFTVQGRTFSDKMYRFPFAQSQLAKAPALVQNPGW
ncbi:RagB/SusD family nutrient uptake outer membrane protein [Daejeonella sp.]|uniref:RagB/SusD family nutrient uptake outer membrane protein n=1 Tax=Daejeonella sp. TaxID=2805397 RepID=UPI0030BA8C24